MGRFPEDFPGLLIPVAVIEGVAGMLKSKYNNKHLFWAGLYVEVVCAVIQSAALIVLVARSSYSRVEIAAACLTIIADAVLLLVEATRAAGSMEIAPVAGKFTFGASVFLAIVLGLSGVPLLLAKLRGRALKRFKSRAPGILMLSLPLLSGFPAVAVCIANLTESPIARSIGKLGPRANLHE